MSITILLNASSQVPISHWYMRYAIAYDKVRVFLKRSISEDTYLYIERIFVIFNTVGELY